MKITIAIALLTFYIITFMGYGLFTIAHGLAHEIPNAIHYHTHSHGNHHHHVEDHSVILGNLKGQKEKNTPSFPFNILYLFSYIVGGITIVFDKQAQYEIILTGVIPIVKTYQKSPPTPPPIHI